MLVGGVRRDRNARGGASEEVAVLIDVACVGRSFRAFQMFGRSDPNMDWPHVDLPNVDLPQVQGRHPLVEAFAPAARTRNARPPC